MDDPEQRTVDTLILMDEPEAMLATIRRIAERQSGPRWARLAQVLAYAEDKLDELNAKPAGPDFRPGGRQTPADSRQIANSEPGAGQDAPSE